MTEHDIINVLLGVGLGVYIAEMIDIYYGWKAGWKPRRNDQDKSKGQ